MKNSNDQRYNLQTIPSLQQELNEFVMQTEQRLQELAGTLSACRDSQRPAAATKPPRIEITQQPLALTPESQHQEPEPAPPSYQANPENATESNIDDADPLARLNAIKQRLAARMDHHNASN